VHDYDRVLGEFAIAREGQPSNAELERAVGEVQRQQGKFEDALASFERAVQLDPRSGASAFQVGFTLLLVRRYAEAERYLDRAISLTPERPFYHVTKFLLYLDWDGDMVRAKAAVTEGIEKVGEAELLSFLSRLWAYGPELVVKVMGEGSEKQLARLDLERFSPDTAGYFLTRAELHAREGREALARAYADSARAVTERLVEAQPEDFYGRLGYAYALLGRKDDAIRAARRGAQASLGVPAVAEQLAPGQSARAGGRGRRCRGRAPEDALGPVLVLRFVLQGQSLHGSAVRQPALPGARSRTEALGRRSAPQDAEAHRLPSCSPTTHSRIRL
jgi:tetratricopeptide (TPR) repeat protein